MKLNHLLGAAAACSLMAGAAYAQSSATSGMNSDPANATGTNFPGHASAVTTGACSNDAAGVGATGPTAQCAPAAAPASSASSTMSGSASMSADTTSTGATATSATTYAQGASVTTTTTTNGPVPDTAANRRKYGGPMSHAGKRSAASGN